MASYFFDSSALAKLYHTELGTDVVEKVARTAGNQIRISRLTAIEMPSVFAIKVRTKFITRDDALVFLRQFRDDVLTGKLQVFPLRESELARAEHLIERYASDLRLRTLDSIQLAVALALRAQRLLDHFVAADNVLCEIAALVS